MSNYKCKVKIKSTGEIFEQCYHLDTQHKGGTYACPLYERFYTEDEVELIKD
jgi:hypothetical protein